MKKEFLIVLLIALAVLLSGCESEKPDEYGTSREHTTLKGETVPFNINNVKVVLDVQEPPYRSDNIALKAAITNNSEETITALFIYFTVKGGDMFNPVIIREPIAPGETKVGDGLIDIDDMNKIYSSNDIGIEKTTVEYSVSDDKKIYLIFEKENTTWEYYDK